MQGSEEPHSQNLVHEGLKRGDVLLDPLLEDEVLSDFAVIIWLHKLPNVPPPKASIHLCLAKFAMLVVLVQSTSAVKASASTTAA